MAFLTLYKTNFQPNLLLEKYCLLDLRLTESSIAKLSLTSKSFLKLFLRPQKSLNYVVKIGVPNISFLFPCTISFPATFTRENLSSFPIFTTWLQFSTFLNGIFIGGLFASFQLTIPGCTLSRASNSSHL